ncbi:MAG TPA: hypothetical protein VGM24_08870 [Puia sp.]|jgi:hypothetical protein
MNITPVILFKSFIKPFYRRNAGLLSFLLFMMTAAVGRANEAGLLEYHYALIRGLMLNQIILLLVLGIWFLYATKCEEFIVLTLRRAEFSFLNILSLVHPKRVFRLLLLVQVLLFLPVILYALLIMAVGFHEHWYGQVITIGLFNLGICAAGARWYLYLLQNPGTTRPILKWRMPSVFGERFYRNFLIRYVLMRRKALLFAIKLYSCGILYLMLVNRVPAEYDLNMIFLFYSFGLLAHGVLIHQIRQMEETRLTFYRGLPVPLFSRWVQYGWLYLFLFIPEILIIGWLTPAHLNFSDAFLFVFFGYSILLLLNSILFIKSVRMTDYLKILVAVFFLLFIAVLTGMVLWLSVFSSILAARLFFRSYYRFER